jgi:O-glycosyl hydrolase
MHRHYKKTFIAVLAMLLATVASIASQSVSSATVQAAPVANSAVYTVSITPAQQYQTIQGWGTSLAWWANIIGGWSDSQRTALADALYSPTKGIGLNVVRYNLGADGPGNVCEAQMKPGRNVPSFEPTQGNYVWTNDANQLWFANAAKARGANVFEGFVNSPPAWMLLNSCTAGAASGADNLNPAHYNDFASYLATIAHHFQQNFGITLQTVEPFNEPQGTWWTSGGTQEGMYVTHSTQNAVIPLISAALAANGASAYTSISAPDDSSVNWSIGDYNSYSSSTMADIAQWNTHSYSGSDSDRAYAYANIGLNDNKNLSMSEWGTGAKATPVAAALALSNQILDDEQNLHPASWVAWQAVNEAGDPSPDDVWGLAYRDSNNTISYPMRYYVMGNYSKFVSQGSTMIGNSDPNTLTTYNAKDHSLVIVATNSTTSSTPVNYDLSQFSSVGAAATPYQTSSTQNLQALPSIPVANAAFATTLPAQSITTFVIPNVTYTGATVSGYYKLVNRNSGKDLDVAGSALTDGAVADQWTDDGNSSQQWTLTPVAGGYYRLFNRNSGKDLDVAGYSTADGGKVDQWTDSGGSNQQWSLVALGNGYYKLVNHNSGKVLDVAGYTTADGGEVDQWTDNGGTNQQWSLVPVVSPPAAVAPHAAQAAPLGWSSWNANFNNINASVIQAATDALVSSGMKAAGYQYVNIDEGWWNGTRDANGNIIVDPTQWPGGMQAIAAYIHSKGLKAGIYTDIGVDGCGGTNQGSYGHYLQDMLQFEQWGFDFVKVDWCGGKELGLNPAIQYAQIRDAIVTAATQTGHPMGLSICEWGLADPWQWGPATGTLWRVSSDISSVQDSATWAGVLKNFDTATLYPEAQAAGTYNDPDMMEVGALGLTDTENQSHFSLWAIAGAPLLAGNDITTMSATTQSILTNREVIAVDQDPLGLQGTKVSEPSVGLQVWSKVLSGSGRRAVVLLNRTASPASITVNWSDLGLAAGKAQVRDLWEHDTKGKFSNSYSAIVASHGVVMLTITGKEAAQTTYAATSPTNTLSGSAIALGCRRCAGGYAVGYVGTGDGNSGTLQFNAIQASLSGPQTVTIAYVNADRKTRTASLNVNGIFTTTVNFPSTLDGKVAKVGTVEIIADLNAGNNALTFSNSAAWAPDFANITLPAATVATTYEAEAPSNTLSGSAVVASCAACSGGHDVGYVGNGNGGNGVLQFNNIVASTAGNHQIVISYINGDGSVWGIGSSRTAYISINGAAPIAVDFPASGDWNLVLTMKLAVNLNVGSNTIALSNSTYWTPDIDKIDVA